MAFQENEHYVGRRPVLWGLGALVATLVFSGCWPEGSSEEPGGSGTSAVGFSPVSPEFDLVSLQRTVTLNGLPKGCEVLVTDEAGEVLGRYVPLAGEETLQLAGFPAGDDLILKQCGIYGFVDTDGLARGDIMFVPNQGDFSFDLKAPHHLGFRAIGMPEFLADLREEGRQAQPTELLIPDTGVHLSHPFIKQLLDSGQLVLGPDLYTTRNAGKDFSNPVATHDEAVAHGTSVVAVAHDLLASEAIKLIVMRMTDSVGSIIFAEVFDGSPVAPHPRTAIRWAIEQRRLSRPIRVVSLSFGFEVAETANAQAQIERQYREVIQEAETAGIMVVASGGYISPDNSSALAVVPAKFATLRVGALNENGQVASYVNYDNDLVAPGENILVPQGCPMADRHEEKESIVCDSMEEPRVTLFDGVSAATPMVAALAADLFAYARLDNLSPFEQVQMVKRALLESAHPADNGDKGGAGVPNLSRASKLLKEWGYW